MPWILMLSDELSNNSSHLEEDSFSSKILPIFAPSSNISCKSIRLLSPVCLSLFPSSKSRFLSRQSLYSALRNVYLKQYQENKKRYHHEMLICTGNQKEKNKHYILHVCIEIRNKDTNDSTKPNLSVAILCQKSFTETNAYEDEIMQLY